MRPQTHKPTNPRVGKYTGDNVVLVAASLLPLRDEWRRLAAALPVGEILMIIPSGSGRLRSMMRALSPALRDRGRHITAVSADRVLRAT